MGFELWTTGTFNADAKSLLKVESRKRKRVKIGWRDGIGVRDYARKAGRKTIIDTLNQHYLKHPLAN